MTTAGDLIQDAVESIGVYAAGETMSAADSARGLAVLNMMIDQWSNEALLAYATTEQSGTLVAEQSAYTIGSGGDFDVPRPLRLLDGAGDCYTFDSNNNKYPVAVLNREQWNMLGNVVNVTSNLPNRMFYDSQYPLGIINVWPTPDTGYQIFFNSYLQLSDFATLATAMTLPPGYEAAIKRNLALELWPYFKPDGAQPPALLARSAAETKAAIKRTNHRPIVAVFDSALTRGRRAPYNIYNDSYNP